MKKKEHLTFFRILYSRKLNLRAIIWLRMSRRALEIRILLEFDLRGKQ
jgi:hypothetical protein